MQSEAQKRASAKYRKTSVKVFSLKFYPADTELYTWLQGQENMNAYIKELIRRDMQARG